MEGRKQAPASRPPKTQLIRVSQPCPRAGGWAEQRGAQAAPTLGAMEQDRAGPRGHRLGDICMCLLRDSWGSVPG